MDILEFSEVRRPGSRKISSMGCTSGRVVAMVLALGVTVGICS